MYEFYSLLGTHAALRNFPKIGQAVAHEILVLQSKAGMIPKLNIHLKGSQWIIIGSSFYQKKLAKIYDKDPLVFIMKMALKKVIRF